MITINEITPENATDIFNWAFKICLCQIIESVNSV
jgi:hypothetical protein